MTRKHHKTGNTLVLVSLALIAVFSACRAGPVGIFASIAQETDINAGRTQAFTDANASFVGKLNPGNYYAIVGTGILYERTIGGNWSKSSIPSGLSDAYALSATVADNILFVVLGVDAPIIYSYDGTTRTAISFTPPTERIVRVLSAGTQLFAITERLENGNSTGKYLIYSYDGTNFDPEYDGTVEGDEISIPNSVTVNAGTYWFDGGSKAITGALGAFDATTVSPPHKLTGVVYHDGVIYASTSEGRILTTVDGTAWTTSSEFENNGEPINFTVPTIVTYGPSTILLVGTSSGGMQSTGSGYYEITLGLVEVSPRAISTATNFDTSINGNSLIGLPQFVEGSGFRVFALTVGNGLWSNFYNGTSWSGWARE
jgi:hypothetical protein